MFSFWVWILIVGVFLIILAGILAGGLHETHGWLWGIFILGVILTLIAIVLAIVAWSKDIHIDNVSDCHRSDANIPPTFVTPSTFSPTFATPESCSMNVVPLSSLSAPSPQFYRSENTNTGNIKPKYFSPLGTPTKTAINVPQAQRGFTSTNLQISSLSPE